MQQRGFPEFYESPNDALIDAVKVLGGYKVVGARLWPEEPPDRAGNKLRDCLNPERREKLSIEQALLILRWSREAGHHDAMQYLCFDLGYEPTKPTHDDVAVAAMQREFVAAVERLQQIQAHMSRVTSRSGRRG